MNYKQVATGFFSVILCLILWEFCYIFFNISTNLIPPPSTILVTLIELLSNGKIISHSLASIKRVLIGFAIASVSGIFVGFLTYELKFLRFSITPLVELLRPIPPIAWIPISILIFGLGDKSAYFIVFLGSFFPIYTSAFTGASTVPKEYRHISQTLELNKFEYFKNILLGHTTPYIFSGLKVGIGMAWMSVIAAEMVGAQSGIGYFIQMNRVVSATDNIIVGMLTIGVIGFALTKAIDLLERRARKYEND